MIPLVRVLRVFVVIAFACPLALLAATYDPDPTFSVGSGPNGTVACIKRLAKGGYLVGGVFTQFDGQAAPGLVKLGRDGRRDASFAPAITSKDGGVLAIALDSQERIYIGGFFSTNGAQPKYSLARLTSTGAIDPTFAAVLPQTSLVASLAVGRDGASLLVGGVWAYQTPGETFYRFGGVGRFALDGSKAAGFTQVDVGLSSGQTPTVLRLVERNDGSLLFVGDFDRVNGADGFQIALVTAAGARDARVSVQQTTNYSSVYDVVLDAVGRMYVAGNFSALGDVATGQLARLAKDGSLDRTFSYNVMSGPSLGGIIDSVLVAADGRLVVGGLFSTAGGVASGNIARLYPDGTADKAFVASADGEVVVVAEDPDGALMVGGAFSRINGTFAPGVARLRSSDDVPAIRAQSGSTTGVAGNNVMLSVTAYGATSYQWYKDGQPISGANKATLAVLSASTGDTGSYTVRATNAAGSVTSTVIPLVIETSTPGRRNLSFTGGALPPAATSALARTPAGTWLALTSGKTPEAIELNDQLVELRRFAIKGFSDFSPLRISVGSDGRVWLSGAFTLTSGATRAMVRLDAAGALDPTFDVGAALEPIRWTVLADGRIVMMNGRFFPQLVRLKVDGSVDSTFTQQDQILDFVVQADGRIVFGRGTQWVGSNSFAKPMKLWRVTADGLPDDTFTSPSLEVLGRRGEYWPARSIAGILVTSSGDLAVSMKDAGLYETIAWLSPDGALRATSIVDDSENGSLQFVGPDRDGGVIATSYKLGLVRFAKDGTWVPETRQTDVSSSYYFGDGGQGTAIVRVGVLGGGYAYREVVTGGEIAGGVLSALSGRGTVGDGESALIAGFSLAGAKGDILLRGVGPTLGRFGVSGFQADPQLEFFSGQERLGRSNDWDAGLAPRFAEAGLFEFGVGSRDAALVSQVGAGAYTSVLTPVNGVAGVGLAEIYNLAKESTVLRALSLRGLVAPGEKALIGGFALTGTGSNWVLIRAVGPTLRTFGVTTALSRPRVTLVRNGTTLGTANSWDQDGSGPIFEAAAQTLGTFPLAAGSNDAVLFLRLPAGLYTAVVSTEDESAGVALLEIYIYNK